MLLFPYELQFDMHVRCAMAVNDRTSNNSNTQTLFVILNKQIGNISISRLRWRGVAVVQLVEALSYKLEGRGFDSRLYIWDFSLT